MLELLKLENQGIKNGMVVIILLFLFILTAIGFASGASGTK
jgi:hypothetical protein